METLDAHTPFGLQTFSDSYVFVYFQESKLCEQCKRMKNSN